MKAHRTVSASAGARSHTLFLTNTGAVYATGSNTFGQLGDGTTDERLLCAMPPHWPYGKLGLATTQPYCCIERAVVHCRTYGSLIR